MGATDPPLARAACDQHLSCGTESPIVRSDQIKGRYSSASSMIMIVSGDQEPGTQTKLIFMGDSFSREVLDAASIHSLFDLACAVHIYAENAVGSLRYRI